MNPTPRFDDSWESLVRAQPGHTNAPRESVDLLIYLSRASGLDPLQRQLYLIGRGGKWQVQTSIDGFRLVASRSGEYAGQAGPQWCGPDGVWRDVWLDAGKPAAARVGVHRKGFAEPCWGVARLEAYSAGGPMWTRMADVMLAKCAESLALRKAFPVELSGLYTEEEMAQAGGDREVAPVAERREWAAKMADPTGWDGRARAVADADLKKFLGELRELYRSEPDVANSARAILKERGLVK